MIVHHELDGTRWTDVVDPTEEELDALDVDHGLGDRTFDEARRRAARPTMQRLADHAYIVAFSGSLAEIDMYIGDGWFITIRRHDEEGREWDPSVAIARVKRLGNATSPAMILATVLEELVDGYFDSTDALENILEEIEERIFGDPVETTRGEQKVQAELFGVRRKLLELRRAVVPLREVLSALLRREVTWCDSDEALIVIRDTFDKLLRAVDIVDELRELVGNAVDAHLAVMSNQMNAVMKQLTAYGSIVFGATLIAGIYGMNFQHMPELEWYFGYPFALGLMAVLSFSLYRVFRRRDWL